MSPASDKWPDEPDEPDPEARWGDPETDLVSVPSVEHEGVDPGSEGGGVEVDPETARRFWAAVVYANVALGGVSIGLLLAGVRGQLRIGGAAVAVGLLALYRTYSVYRTHQERAAEGGGEEGSQVDGGAGDDVDAAGAE